MPAKKKEIANLEPLPTWNLTLNKVQLLHLRDLLSILLPPDGSKTVSQALAAGEQRTIAETQLWREVSALCKKAKVPLNNAAPDFVIMLVGAPTLEVIRIAEDPDAVEQAGPDGDPSQLFEDDGEGLKEKLTTEVMKVLTAAAEAGAGEPSAEPTKKPAPKRKAAKGKKK